MAEWIEPDGPDLRVQRRPYTPAEVARVRELIAAREPWPRQETERALDAVHEAVGRGAKGFRLWELDPIRSEADLDRAVAEEVGEWKW